MRRPPPFPEGSKEKLSAALKSARTKGQYQLVLCLWLREALRMSAPQVALATGMTVSGVWHIWSRYLQKGEVIFKEAGRGGRHRQNLSLKAERDFLNGLLYFSEVGQTTIDTRAIQEAYERLRGRPVSVSVVHRLLKRHGWRPVDRSQIRLPQGWAPGERFQSDRVPLYEEPPTDNDSETAAANEFAKRQRRTISKLGAAHDACARGSRP